MTEWIIIGIVSSLIGYYGHELDLHLTNRNEQRLIDRIESLGWSAVIGWDDTVNLWIVHAARAGDKMQVSHGVSRIVALSKMLNELENMK